MYASLKKKENMTDAKTTWRAVLISTTTTSVRSFFYPPNLHFLALLLCTIYLLFVMNSAYQSILPKKKQLIWLTLLTMFLFFWVKMISKHFWHKSTVKCTSTPQNSSIWQIFSLFEISANENIPPLSLSKIFGSNF